MANKKQISFNQVIQSLLDVNVPFPPRYLSQFSDLTPENTTRLSQAWLKIPAERRVTLLEDLETIMDADTLASFDAIAGIALHDPEPRARQQAILLLWDSPSRRLIPTYIHLATHDPAEEVRAQAVDALGNFVMAGELEDISGKDYATVKNALVGILNGQDGINVRRRAIESLGYSGHEEIEGLIQAAYDQGDALWKASALNAMGRNADAERWGKIVLSHLNSEQYDMRLEAVRAAGNLELEAARPSLLNLLEENADDELVDMAVWSLSHIGGEGVMEAFEKRLSQTDDEDEIEFMEDAMDNLVMLSTLDKDGMDLFEMDIDQDDTGLDTDDEEHPGTTD